MFFRRKELVKENHTENAGAAIPDPQAVNRVTESAPVMSSAESATQPAGSQQASLNSQLAAQFGKIVSVLMLSGHHGEMTLSAVVDSVLPPLLANQFVVAEARPEGQDITAPVGLILWARVSAEVDRRMQVTPDQPAKPGADEWSSGDNIWIIEAVGAAAVRDAMFKQLFEGPLSGQTCKVRARGTDGRYRIETIEIDRKLSA